MLSSLQLSKTNTKYWEDKWLEESDFKPILQRLADKLRDGSNTLFSVIDGGDNEVDDRTTILLNDEDGNPKSLFITYPHDLEYLNVLNKLHNVVNSGGGVCLQNVGNNHWIAVDVKKTSVGVSCTVADSLPQYICKEEALGTNEEKKWIFPFPATDQNGNTVFTYDKRIFSSEKVKKFTANEYFECFNKIATDDRYVNNFDTINNTTYWKLKEYLDKYNVTFTDKPNQVFQQNTWDCGIFALLNAIDMALNNQGKNVLCTQARVEECRKWFCEAKAEKALQNAKEDLHIKYTVNKKEWRVMSPPPLLEKNHSPLMTLLTQGKLVENGGNQRQFLFEFNSNKKTSYIDTKYNHTAVAKGDYELQTTIEKHTNIITDGLIDAYKTVYGGGTANFCKIKEIWGKAQDETGWNEMRARYTKDINEGNKPNEYEANMLMFSKAFQDKMTAGNLMTGNQDSTNFVGMRLKRVSSYHMEELKKGLEMKTQLAVLSSNPNSQFSKQKEVKKKVKFYEKNKSIFTKKNQNPANEKIRIY